MNEKSKAFELIEFVWNNEKTDSYLRVNIAMYEIMPVDINLLQQEINEGYIMLSDGRYLPPKEAVQQCYNAFGIRVGLGDNWEDIYDGWNKEMK